MRSLADGRETVVLRADAHGIGGLTYADYGINMARKGWLQAEDILNSRPVDEFLANARKRSLCRRQYHQSQRIPAMIAP